MSEFDEAIPYDREMPSNTIQDGWYLANVGTTQLMGESERPKTTVTVTEAVELFKKDTKSRRENCEGVMLGYWPKINAEDSHQMDTLKAKQFVKSVFGKDRPGESLLTLVNEAEGEQIQVRVNHYIPNGSEEEVDSIAGLRPADPVGR